MFMQILKVVSQIIKYFVAFSDILVPNFMEVCQLIQQILEGTDHGHDAIIIVSLSLLIT
jgi:pyridoxal/pyridoxine/pyridoxamine kinase